MNNPNTQLPIDEVWDDHSVLIGDDIDDLSYWAGREVMDKDNFSKATAACATKLQEVQQENARLKIALENVYRIHRHQWSEYDRNVIKDLIK
jgi:hypothetical protein